ncbi:receptor protein kinase TMK1-like [Impatiens glandulifera]|uniref:receptor protein kinase TMK1-like n=1 Tax=Impatiens glandulifera TaxID=253017 RepID=UPI001FB09F18|nr:receptor protein kinase TMK1-like [Impatiens glandulifera]
MLRRHPASRVYFFLFLTLQILLLLSSCIRVTCQSSASDADVMQDLKTSLGLSGSLTWTDSDPCKWALVSCSNDKRVISIQIGKRELKGSLPSSLSKLTALQRFEVRDNELTGPLPSLAGLSSLQNLLLNNNNFSSIPSDFFSGMSSLQFVYLDYNPFSAWQIPESLSVASSLKLFSAISANIVGNIPDFFGGVTFPVLTDLRLSFNSLSGELPRNFSHSYIQNLWLNSQRGSSPLNGSLSVLQNMTQLTQVWLHGNSFSGPLPDFSQLNSLQDLSLRDNRLTGLVPDSLVNLQSLKVVNLTNNMLQGPRPMFNPKVALDLVKNTNSFCLDDLESSCDPIVDTLLSIAKSVGYPVVFASSWKGNDPCKSWAGLTCLNVNITVVNFQKMGLIGTISSNFSLIHSLQRLILSNNNLSGTIPVELATLPNLKYLDLSNNNLHGLVPPFRSNVVVKRDGNPDIGNDASPTPSGKPPSSSDATSKTSLVWLVVGLVIAVLLLIVAGVFCVYKSKQKRSNRVQSPNDNGMEITLANSGPSKIHIDIGTMSIGELRRMTNNFSQENILGRGGFGTVYKGVLNDGTNIAVKRMESGVMGEKGFDEFKSEIAVLTKVRHRHLVSLLGYCLEGNERLLVYEYMDKGPLSKYLFNWKEEGVEPLGWSRRLIIALDVARGVEYLHGLARQSFIHRDLKPSNILLGVDMRAKVSDFGLVRNAPDKMASLATKLAGTFGYLAPEYAATGRITTKVDVYSFGVILMELIMGQMALDNTRHEAQLVHWFDKLLANKDTFVKAIDPTIDLNQDDETLSNISIVAELAGHCSSRDPYRRPEMSHVVNVLSSLAEQWKPTINNDQNDNFGINFGGRSLSEELLNWQAYEGMPSAELSRLLHGYDNTQTNIIHTRAASSSSGL